MVLRTNRLSLIASAIHIKVVAKAQRRRVESDNFKKGWRQVIKSWATTSGENRYKNKPVFDLHQKQVCFIGAPDWIRTSGLPGRSRTLYPTELRTHIYENRPKTDFNYSVVSGQIVVRLLQNRGMRCRKMAYLCGFSAAFNCLSELSEPNALSNWATDAYAPFTDASNIIPYFWAGSKCFLNFYGVIYISPLRFHHFPRGVIGCY